MASSAHANMLHATAVSSVPMVQLRLCMRAVLSKLLLSMTAQVGRKTVPTNIQR